VSLAIKCSSTNAATTALAKPIVVFKEFGDTLHQHFAFTDPIREATEFAHIESKSEFLSNFPHGLAAPSTKPIDNATIEESWGGRRTILPVTSRRIHCEDYVKIALDERCESTPQLFLAVEYDSVLQGAISTGIAQSIVFVAFEQPWHFATGKESVDCFDKRALQAVGIIKDECDPFALQGHTLHDISQIVVKVIDSVLGMSLDLTYIKAIHPSNKKEV
jgi:hypothetical protein